MKRLMAVLIVMVLNFPVLADYTYEISSGYFGTLTLEGSETLLMTGGGVYNLSGGDNTILDIRNTSSPVVAGKSGIGDLNIGGSGQLNLSGGYIAHISVGGNATAFLSGGQINTIISYYFFPADPTHILLYCQPGYQLIYTGNVVTRINGLWQDNTAFNIQLVTQTGYSDLFSNMTIIPEPATMLLLGLGGLVIRRK